MPPGKGNGMEHQLPGIVRHTQAEKQRLTELLRAELLRNECKIVVLDDDPTGTQTVHDVPVYTRWDRQIMGQALAEPGRAFYILTNNRARSAAETEQVCREIGENLAAAAEEQNRNCLVICRGDSTLRGHYPLETQTLRRTLEKEGARVNGEILCPFFEEGGRFTLHGMHYVQQGGELVPAKDTEFSKDRTFGYSSSFLPRYIEEKTAGQCHAQQVLHIPRELLFEEGIDRVEALLCGCTDCRRICVDACEYADLTAFAVGFYRALARGKQFLIQSAASLVKVLAGIEDRPLLLRSEMTDAPHGGGVVIVGSHTEKTTRQLERLLTLDNVIPVPFRASAAVESAQALDREVERCVALEEQILRRGCTAVCYTERDELPTDGLSREEALRQSVRVGEGVQRLVACLKVAPSFIVAKGGITSSDIATKALEISRAMVLGQIKPGVSVWRTPPESRFPGIPYVVFPGNVGDEDTLRQTVQCLLSIQATN